MTSSQQPNALPASAVQNSLISRALGRTVQWPVQCTILVGTLQLISVQCYTVQYSLQRDVDISSDVQGRHFQGANPGTNWVTSLGHLEMCWEVTGLTYGQEREGKSKKKRMEGLIMC